MTANPLKAYNTERVRIEGRMEGKRREEEKGRERDTGI